MFFSELCVWSVIGSGRDWFKLSKGNRFSSSVVVANKMNRCGVVSGSVVLSFGGLIQDSIDNCIWCNCDIAER